MTEKFDVIVLGAGVSGLSSAYFLKQSGLNVRVIESEAECGGRIRTISDGRYLIEAGPNTLQSKDTDLWDLVCALGLEGEVELAPSCARRRWIVRNGKLALLPGGPAEIFSTKALTWGGILRAAMEPFCTKRPDGSENVASFVTEHFGREVCDYLLNPFVRGIYAGNPEQLSIKAAFPKIFEAAQRKGSIIRGFMAGPRSAKKRNRPAASIYTFAGGIGALVSALRLKLDGAVETSAKALKLSTLQDGTFLVEFAGQNKAYRAQRVVLTVPADMASQLISPLDTKLASAFSNLSYPSLAVIYTAFKKEQVQHPLDGFGFLAPACEKRFVLGTLFSSSLAAKRAPEGEVLLTSMVGGASEPEKFALSDSDLIAGVLKDLDALLGTTGEPVFSKVVRWDRSIPQYGFEQLTLQSSIEDFEKRFPGIHFSGNYRSGVSVGACVKDAKFLADTLANTALQTAEKVFCEVQNG